MKPVRPKRRALSTGPVLGRHRTRGVLREVGCRYRRDALGQGQSRRLDPDQGVLERTSEPLVPTVDFSEETHYLTLHSEILQL